MDINASEKKNSEKSDSRDRNENKGRNATVKKSYETQMALNGILQFIEANVKNDFRKDALEKAAGMTYHTARQFFKQQTGSSLKSYMDARRIAHAAFELQKGERSATDLSCDYGFDVYDTFTRCFKRECGITPSEFRRDGGVSVSMGLVAMGIYGPVLQVGSCAAPKPENTKFSADATGLTDSTGAVGPSDSAGPKETAKGRCVLYGVPKVEFSSGKCVPFNACLESLLTYSGDIRYSKIYSNDCRAGAGSGSGMQTFTDVLYPYLMAASGAAFRFCWNPGKWDMAGSDLRNMNPEDPYEAFKKAVRASGRSCSILKREKSGKEAFAKAIRESIDEGIPVIGFGIVGPPEASLVTGYEDGGETLLGWSYFQDNPEFAAEITRCDNGYYRCGNWWENPCTAALLTVGEPVESLVEMIEVFKEAAKIMETGKRGAYLYGDLAYEAWATDLLTDSCFREGTVLPVLAERFLSQSDAETMLTEGRYWAGEFFRMLAEEAGKADGGQRGQADSRDRTTVAADLEKLYSAAAGCCFKVWELGKEMTAARNGMEPGEGAVYQLCERSAREKLVALIQQVRYEERELQKILNRLAG